MAAADKLTLAGAFGVDLAALARRLADRQAELGRDDDACAKLAGVTVDRWRAWTEGREVPGVGRVPNLSAAVDAPAAWILYGATSTSETRLETAERSTADTRRVLDILTRLAPAVETVETLAEEVDRFDLAIPGGAKMGMALGKVAQSLVTHDAISSLTASQR